LGLVTGLHGQILVHVSQNAADGGDGSKAKPFQNILQARDHLRQARKTGKIPDTETVIVELAAGVYRLAAPVEFTAEDGGRPGAPVIYRAAEMGKAQLRGGVPLPAGAFRKVSDPALLARLAEGARPHVLVCDLANIVDGELPEFPNAYRATPVAPWLYADGQPMTLARWPNKDAENNGWVSFSKVVDQGLPQPGAEDPALRKVRPGAFVFDHPRAASWDLEAGAWLFGYWTHDWSEETIRIASYDAGKKTIRLAAAHGYGIMGGTWGAKERRFFAQNILAELDSPGEWFVDRKAKKLFYYPVAPIAHSQLVLVTNSAPLIGLTHVRHLKINGLKIEYNHGTGISIKQGEDIEIAGCELSNLAGTAIDLSGKNLTLRSCDIFNIGRNGVSLNGGDRKTLEKSGNLVVNNHIHHYGIFQRTYAPGIGVGGCGSIVRQNLIHDAPHNAISYSGNEHLFELNEIHRVMLETGDSGAFYSGRDWTSQGNILRHNYIHHLGGKDVSTTHTMGIYLDDCDSGDTLEGNILYRAGRALMIGGGRNNPVLNNLVIDCPIGLHFDGRGMSWKQWNNPSDRSWMLEAKAEALNYKNPPWSERYPLLAKIMSDSPKEPLYNPIRNNIFINCRDKVLHLDRDSASVLPKLEIEHNLVVQTGEPNPKALDTITNHPGFTLAQNPPADLGYTVGARGGFQMKADSWLLRQNSAFAKIPCEKIGLQKDACRQSLP
jgi:hypothetical protein